MAFNESDKKALGSYFSEAPVGAGSPAQQTGALSGSAISDYLPKNSGVGGAPIQGPGASPETAIQDSAVTLEDRMKLSVGNVKGSVSYLKKKFDDVAVMPDHGIMVKKDDVWHTVDPQYLGNGDAWEKTQELVKDLADVAPAALNAVIAAPLATAGGVGGAALGAGGASVPLAVAGEMGGAAAGGAISSSITTSLGRLVGTYQATPEDQLKDIGLEALYTMGGQSIALGAKPAISGAVKAAKYIGSLASEGGSEAISQIIGKTTNAGAPAIRALLDNASAVGSRVSKYVNLGGSSDGAISQAAQDIVQKTGSFLQGAIDALPQKYGKLLDGLFENDAAKKMSVNFSDIIANVGKSLEDKGLGKIVKGSGRTLEFVPFSVEEQVGRQEMGQVAENLGPELEKQMSSIVNRLTPYANLNDVKGKVAAKNLVAMNKLLNELGTDAFNNNSASAIKRGVSEMSSSFRNAISSQFEKVGLSAEYGQLSSTYSKYGDAITWARDVVGKNTGPEGLANALSTEAGKKATVKGNSALLVELLNSAKEGAGTAAYQDIVQTNAAKNLISIFPKAGITQIGAAMSAGTAALVKGAAVLNPITAGAAILSPFVASPRLVTKEAQMMQGMGNAAGGVMESAVKYGATGLNFLKSLTPQQMQVFVKSDAAINGFTQLVSGAVAREQQMKSELVNRADGATQPQQPQMQQQPQ